eukprot:scaffold80422_cov18-Tisochrysis_lutea.AAC.1
MDEKPRASGLHRQKLFTSVSSMFSKGCIHTILVERHFEAKYTPMTVRRHADTMVRCPACVHASSSFLNKK